MLTVEERTFLEEMALKHRPGGVDHDQRSHGRRGGGLTHALTAASNVEELAAAATAEAKRITGRDIPFDFTGSDLEIGRGHAEGVLLGLERFPKARLTGVSTYGPGSKPSPATADLNRTQSGNMAVTSSYVTQQDGQWGKFGNIYFNNAFAADPDKYTEAQAVDAHKSALPSTPTGTALHEFGHVLSNHEASTVRAVLDSVTEHAEAEGLTPRVYITRNISAYASSMPSELSAEVFADVMLNGDKASAASQSGFKLLEAAYRGES